MKRHPTDHSFSSKKKVRFDSAGVAGGSKPRPGSVSGFGDMAAFEDRGGDDNDDLEDLEFGRKKRFAIKEGYTESDEEDLNFEDDDDAKKENSDDDMFGDSAPKPGKSGKAEPKKPRKGVVEYISRQRIDLEGAERANEDDLDEDENGIKIEQFNMDQELEDGGFDADFNYIRKKDEHLMHDNWLQGVTKDDIKKARQAHNRQEARAKAQDMLENAKPKESDAVLWQRLLRFLQPKESVAAAMKRLGSGTVKQPAWKKKKAEKEAAKAKKSNVLETLESEEEKAKLLEQLISITDKLIENGHYEVIEHRYESIVRILRAEDVLPEDWNPGDPLPPIAGAPESNGGASGPEGGTSTSSNAGGAEAGNQETLWEYKWGKDSTELFGPYTADMMEEWKKNGFFNSERGELWVREVNSSTPLDTQKGFLHVSEVSFV
ncbi:hypothetical protein HDU96_008795 [Phlyctochytrium bullatum]|nr:hypothetical protein HDU96_008795 [Phlyctochytrium bullatum]